MAAIGDFFGVDGEVGEPTGIAVLGSCVAGIGLTGVCTEDAVALPCPVAKAVAASLADDRDFLVTTLAFGGGSSA